MENFNNFIRSVEEEKTPYQHEKDWLKLRQEKCQMGGSTFSQLFAPTYVIDRAFLSIVNPNDRFVYNFTHGHVFEEINRGFLEILLMTKVHPAKTLVGENKSATTDGYLFFANKSWSLGIKSQVRQPCPHFTMGHLMQMLWAGSLLPSFFAGSIYFTQCWVDIDSVNNRDICGWVTITLPNTPADIQYNKMNIFRLIHQGEKWNFKNFSLTLKGVELVQGYRKKINRDLNTNIPLVKNFFVANGPPPITNEPSITFALMGGFFGILEYQPYEKIFEEISRRFQTVASNIRNLENCRNNIIQRMIFENSFLASR